MKKLRVIALIQARMGSQRLPRKALRKIGSKTLTEIIFERLKTAKEIDDIVLSTSLKKENDSLVNHAKKISLKYYRGSEEDLISRIFETAKEFKADAILRVTGDCPLVDPSLADNLVNVFRKNPQKFDYLTNVLPRTFPDGLDLELYPFSTLSLLNERIAKESPYRENFPSFILDKPKEFRIFSLKNSENLSSLRLTVDYKEDLDLVSIIVETLGKDGRMFGLTDILNLLKSKPELVAINKKYVIY